MSSDPLIFHRQSVPKIQSKLQVSANIPFTDFRIHNVGNILISVSNYGIYGLDANFEYRQGIEHQEYPKGSGNRFSIPSVAIGGLLGRDTLVSWSGELFPHSEELQFALGENMQVRSIHDDVETNPAHSEQDISCVYYDNITHPLFTLFDEVENRPHKPLNLRIEQTSYAWSYPYADDFILVEYNFSNIGLSEIRDLYIGVFLLGEVNGGRRSGFDDISGFLRSAPAFTTRPTSCQLYDIIDVVWAADNDGDPNPSTEEFDGFSIPGVMGIRFLQVPTKATTLSFNWWHCNGEPECNFGPRLAAPPGEPFRLFDGNLGYPAGDRNLYYVMSSGEIDYNQLFTAIDHSQFGWLPPPPNAAALAFGNVSWLSERLLSIGPFDLAPGESVPFAFAYVGGEGFHTDPKNLDNWNPYQPQKFIDNLDFSDLIRNATWASWVYDNPGFDTDDDGYRGEFYVCETSETTTIDTSIVVDTLVFPPETTVILDTTVKPLGADTIFYSGDGVPDIRAASPPPAPEVRVNSSHGQLIIEWNGLKSETTPDIFSQEIDFEGYRAYLGLAKRKSDLQILSSYDIEDYTQYYFKLRPGTFNKGDWVILRIPFTLREAQLAYARGNPDYNPLFNEIENPLHVGDSVFYFVRQDFNQSDLSDTTAIHRLYPDAPYPHTLNLGEAFTDDTWYVDELTGDSVFYEGGELTPDGKYFKFFEYRYIAENLLPSLAYFVSVTAFDFGSPESGLAFLETNPVNTAIEAFALEPTEQQPQGGLNVIVYPNPYRIDNDYREQGFEARGREQLPDFRTREVHFVNLPPRCKISIFSIDGDLVSQIEHDRITSDPSAMHESWNLLTRNTQLSTSGIYYWVVETPEGDSQIGKLVLIM